MTPIPRTVPGLDLTRAPVLGAVLGWRHLRTLLQSLLLLFAVATVYDGFAGSPMAPKNLAGVLPWIQWRGLTVVSLLLAGSLFCTACPFMLTRRLSKKLFAADRAWPAPLRGKWLAGGILIAYFWVYEALDPWAVPWMTAALALAYFAAAFVVDGLFRGAAFCKYLCPIGQFNFVNSTCSPVEVRVRDDAVCRECASKACVAGLSQSSVPGPEPPAVPRPPIPHPRLLQQGCELFLFQQQKVGNLDCTFCLDCLHACPSKNVGVVPRLPVAELWDTRRRSGIGRLSDRPDVAFLALVMVFGAFLNASGMVGPFHGFERWLMGLLGIDAEWLVLAVVFGVGLGLLPAALVGATALLSRAAGGSTRPIRSIAARFSFALVPLGFGMWMAHYGFHFLSGGLTVIPVTQAFFTDIGWPVFGAPRWGLAALLPGDWLLPVEIALLEAGLLGSLVAAYKLALGEYGGKGRTLWGFLPWAVLALALFAAGVWLMLQPMEMRGMMSGG
ncbi:MAG TPA: FesM [Chloroflexota bacterium]